MGIGQNIEVKKIAPVRRVPSIICIMLPKQSPSNETTTFNLFISWSCYSKRSTLVSTFINIEGTLSTYIDLRNAH